MWYQLPATFCCCIYSAHSMPEVVICKYSAAPSLEAYRPLQGACTIALGMSYTMRKRVAKQPRVIAHTERGSTSMWSQSYVHRGDPEKNVVFLNTCSGGAISHDLVCCCRPFRFFFHFAGCHSRSISEFSCVLLLISDFYNFYLTSYHPEIIYLLYACLVYSLSWQ